MAETVLYLNNVSYLYDLFFLSTWIKFYWNQYRVASPSLYLCELFVLHNAAYVEHFKSVTY